MHATNTASVASVSRASPLMCSDTWNSLPSRRVEGLYYRVALPYKIVPSCSVQAGLSRSRRSLVEGFLRVLHNLFPRPLWKSKKTNHLIFIAPQSVANVPHGRPVGSDTSDHPSMRYCGRRTDGRGRVAQAPLGGRRRKRIFGKLDPEYQIMSSRRATEGRRGSLMRG